jgi:hypothetical protein
MNPEPTNLDASVITEPLDSLVAALAYKIEREWPASLANIRGGRELFLLTLRTADVTSRSIRYLCAERPFDPNRIIEYCLSVPPLNRTILDNLFTLMFVLEDLPMRCHWYHKAAWREERMELERYRTEFGHIPEWKGWLDQLSAHSRFGIAFLGVSANEVSDPRSIVRWPNCGAMPSYGLSPTTEMPPNRRFMKYLNDWFYMDLSQQAHLGGTGLMKRAAGLLYDRSDPEHLRVFTKNKYAWIGQTIGLMLALGSELEAYLNFGLSERFNYVWGLAAPVIVVVKELYEKRYGGLLTARVPRDRRTD